MYSGLAASVCRPVISQSTAKNAHLSRAACTAGSTALKFSRVTSTATMLLCVAAGVSATAAVLLELLL
jgi:hypothetical protein